MFLQIAVILAACRLVGWLGARFFGQTQVVSEMVAGVLLGPSLFGLLAPAAQSWLFPKSVVIAGTAIAHPSMAILYAVSQIGLVLYMFVIGLELDIPLIRERKRSAGMISGAGIIVPFILGAGLALYLIDRADLFTPSISRTSAALYLGASMSITAFPMLARILFEQGIARTPLGTTTLAAGSLDDALAWCLLALVLASTQASPIIAVLAIGGTIVYVFAMATVGRRLLARFQTDEAITGTRLTAVLLVVMICAWFTDAIGVYAVFGAFIAGAAMPRGAFNERLQELILPLTTTLLLPIFFVYSGLNTRIDMLAEPSLLGIAAMVIIAAVVGKGVACTLAARWAGFSWRDALSVGTLMNARGLMELIILNIGLQEGLITPTLFTIMVLMAIITTLMASPIYRAVAGRA